ncbi:hypothetical protein DL96DRAFT_1499069 [Flagelloscypha sp. PMI_526]|nr:hypothetical protein DL96DRAFT_1499069 [Flagelloscypha sp. PMI_526]
MVFFHLFPCACFVVLTSAATLPDPLSLWTLGPLNTTDELYAGFKQIEGVKHTKLYDGSEIGRTYSHHAIVENINGKLWAAWSSAVNDEDSMGQQVWLSTATRQHSKDEWKWAKPIVAFPSALLANQTSFGERNFTFWCDLGVAQRAGQPATIVEYGGFVYLIMEPADLWCIGGVKYDLGPGRLAARFSLDGKLLTKPCWLIQNQVTKDTLWAQTIIGDKMCSPSLVNTLGKYLDKPDVQPFTNSLLLNSPNFAAADGTSWAIEVTRAVWNEKGQYWRRHWRDASSKTSYVNLVEFSTKRDGSDWFPLHFNPNGSNPSIIPSNIPDSNTKSFYGELPDGRTYLVSNLMYHPDGPRMKERQPLCISVASDGVHIDWAGVLRTNATLGLIPDSRKIKRYGFSYPHATVLGDKLYVGYSENKEDIWITEVPISSLGKKSRP